MDDDGTFDVFFTLVDILTRRAVFHIERADSAERRTGSIVNKVGKNIEQAFNFTERKLGIKEYTLILVMLTSWIVVIMLYLEYRRYKKR